MNTDKKLIFLEKEFKKSFSVMEDRKQELSQAESDPILGWPIINIWASNKYKNAFLSYPSARHVFQQIYYNYLDRLEYINSL